VSGQCKNSLSTDFAFQAIAGGNVSAFVQRVQELKNSYANKRQVSRPSTL
jgi:hypothetical protein